LIEPGNIIDRHGERSARGRLAHESQDGQRDGEGLGPLVLHGRPQQRDVEGETLRRRQLRLDLVQEIAEQVDKAGEWQAGLRLGRPRADDPEAALRGHGQRLLPDGALADPGFAAQEERARARARRQESANHIQLCFAPDDRQGVAPRCSVAR
jgi:hypothetical protein